MLLEMRIGAEMGKEMGKEMGMAVSCWLFAFVKGFAKHNEVRKKQGEKKKRRALLFVG